MNRQIIRSFLLAAMLLLPVADAFCISGLVRPFILLHPEDSNGVADVAIYWELDATSIRYATQPDKTVSARLLVQVQALTDTGAVIEDAFLITAGPTDANGHYKAAVIFQKSYHLPPGSYSLQCLINQQDDLLAQPLAFADSVSIPAAGQPGLLLQPVFPVADSQEHSATANFYPLMLPFLDSAQQAIHFTAQFISSRDWDTAQPLLRRFYITRGTTGKELYGFSDTAVVPAGQHSSLISGFLNITALPSGNYQLRGSLLDKAGHVIARAPPRFFQRYNSALLPMPKAVEDTSATGPALLNIATTFVGKYNMDQRRAILKMLIPTADNAMLASIKMLQKSSDPGYTGYFIYNYFAAKNEKNPAAAWSDFAATIKKVNRLFGGSVPGYETDRGIMYLRYGPPPERFRVPNEAGALPYEVWRYPYLGNLNRPQVFLFVQDGLTQGDYRLIHSSYPVEVQNNAWGVILFQGNARRLETSRAFRYMTNL